MLAAKANRVKQPAEAGTPTLEWLQPVLCFHLSVQLRLRFGGDLHGTILAAIIWGCHRPKGGFAMQTTISLPELGLIAGTRAALGVGLGLLLADRFSPEQRRAIGWTLVLIGASTTVPLALEVLSRDHRQPQEGQQDRAKSEYTSRVQERAMAALS
jgi:hypothetical protein